MFSVFDCTLRILINISKFFAADLMFECFSLKIRFFFSISFIIAVVSSNRS